MGRRWSFASLALLLAALAARHPATPRAAGHVAAREPLVLKVKGLPVPYHVLGVALMPGESTVLERDGDGPPLRVRCDRGTVTPLGHERFRYGAPDAPGEAKVWVEDGSGASLTLNVFVMVEAACVRDGVLDGYRIGDYPSPPLRGQSIYEPPRGFVRVTEANAATPLSPHVALRQMLCKQAGGFPKYVVVEERLVLMLERIVEKLEGTGIAAPELGFVSGYRTPAYNASIHDNLWSRHQWGDAADIFVDTSPRDGRMDDLDHDGRIGLGDAQVLYDLIDAMGPGGAAGSFQGGLGLYDATRDHGPFVHVDMRGKAARWRG